MYVNVKNLLKAASFFAAVAGAYVFRRCSRYNDTSSAVISSSSPIPNFSPKNAMNIWISVL
jgi:hypothetical protein